MANPNTATGGVFGRVELSAGHDVGDEPRDSSGQWTDKPADDTFVEEGKFAARYLAHFGGWLAFKHGKALRKKSGANHVFGTSAEALKAARKSEMQFGVR